MKIFCVLALSLSLAAARSLWSGDDFGQNLKLDAGAEDKLVEAIIMRLKFLDVLTTKILSLDDFSRKQTVGDKKLFTKFVLDNVSRYGDDHEFDNLTLKDIYEAYDVFVLMEELEPTNFDSPKSDRVGFGKPSKGDFDRFNMKNDLNGNFDGFYHDDYIMRDDFNKFDKSKSAKNPFDNIFHLN